MTHTHLDTDAEQAWQVWRSEREHRLSSEYGWLSIISFTWLDDAPSVVDDVPGLWFERDGVAVLTAEPRDGLVLCSDPEVPLSGEVTLSPDADAPVRWVRHGDRIVELLLRSGRLALRVRDPRSALRTAFAGVPTFAYAPEWVVTGRYEALDTERHEEVGTSRPELRQQTTLTGTVTFERDGTSYSLLGSEYDGEIDLFFHDASNGIDTPGWRTVSTSVPGPDGSVVIDFNRTLNLPCAFTEFGTCPMPVQANRLPFPVNAGEKAVTLG